MPPKSSEYSPTKAKKLLETSGAGTPGQSKGGGKPDKKKFGALYSLLIFSLVFGGLFYYFFQGFGGSKEIPISEFVQSYKAGKYSKVEIRDSQIIGTLAKEDTKSGDQFTLSKKSEDTQTSVLPANDGLKDIGIDIALPVNAVKVADMSTQHFWADMLPMLIMSFLFLILFILFVTRMMASGGGPMGFAKSKAKRYEPSKNKVMFADVAGSAEEKLDLQEFVDFLKTPNKYKKLGAKIPRGVLMVGPPGTGKTLLARAVAGESNVPFYSISGSEFVEMFVGVGAARVRDLFNEAKTHAPAIIFIDEIDAIGKRRAAGFGGGHDEREQTLNQILTEMDGFDNETNVIVMGATNRADVLDRALLRPGRFDRKVHIHLPNLEDRLAILHVHAKNKPIVKSANLKKIASSTIGFSGADLENLLNEAAILAGRENSHEITQHMLQQSIEKILMGNTKKSHVMSEFEQKLTAYHEVGHAMVGKMTAHSDPVHKISIISRGSAGGVTWFLPERDRTYVTKAKMLDELAVFFGGRAAEEIFFGPEYVTTGASSDIEKATDIARDMVTRYGFDEDIGLENVAFRIADGNFLGAAEEGNPISDQTKNVVDIKVRKLLADAYERAKKIIKSNKELHEKIAKVLQAKQEMLQDEFDAFFEGVSVPEKVEL